MGKSALNSKTFLLVLDNEAKGWQTDNVANVVLQSSSQQFWQNNKLWEGKVLRDQLQLGVLKQDTESGHQFTTERPSY